MFEALETAFFTPGTGFMPHGMCLSWQPGALWLNVISDALITLAYLSIPFVLLTFLRRRRDFELGWILLLFAAFIFCCAMTHAIGVWVVWHPDFVAQGMVKLVTAIVSLTTALALWPLLPKALALPAPAQLRAANLALEQANAELEERVARRTREVDQTLRELQTIVDGLPAHIAHFDPDDRLVRWNRMFEGEFVRLVGHPPRKGMVRDAIVRARLAATGLEGDALEESVRLQTERHRQLEQSEVQLQDRTLLVSKTRAPDGGIFTIAVDVTGQKAAERNLRHVFYAAPTAMLMVDLRGDIQLANRQAETLLGRTAAELLTLNVDTLVPDDARDAHAGLRENYTQAPEARPMGAGRELYARHRSGALVPVEITLTPIDAGQDRMVIAGLVDISERKAARLAERRHAAALERSNRDLAHFAAIASHDLQEPLRTIHAFLALLQKRYGQTLNDEARDLVTHAADGAARMKRLIEDLLAYSRAGADSFAREPVALREVVDDICQDFSLRIDELGATIDAEDLPTVETDRARVTQVLRNLIGNAIKYHGDAVPEVGISATRHEDGWVIAVADNGIGIADDDRDTVFRLFSRLHGRAHYEGTGIGLAICERIVTGWGGRIWVESVPGEGSTFRFTIPSAAARGILDA